MVHPYSSITMTAAGEKTYFISQVWLPYIWFYGGTCNIVLEKKTHTHCKLDKADGISLS